MNTQTKQLIGLFLIIEAAVSIYYANQSQGMLAIPLANLFRLVRIGVGVYIIKK